MIIKRSIDIEETIRSALSDFFNVYCRPLPEEYALPNILVQQVGGTEEESISIFDVTLDARASGSAEALETLRNAIGALQAIAGTQETPISHVVLNTLGSWGKDPVRPDLELFTARLNVFAHKEQIEI